MRSSLRLRRTGLLSVALAVVFGMAVQGADIRHEKDKQVAPMPLTDAVTAPARDLSRAFVAVAAHVTPAVVSVYSDRIVKVRGDQMPFPFGDDFLRQFFGQGNALPPEKEYSIPQHGMGSGMILDKKGHILTNNHVVRDMDEIKVQLADKRSFEAEVVGTDPMSDVAIIRIKGTVPDDLSTVELGDSESLMAGELVMAVGAPFGLAQTVTTGIISAKGRANVGVADFEDFLQTDASINPGNSGGPLVNMRGEVIGMNTAIAGSFGQSAGVGFSIPVNMVKSLLATLLKGGTVQRGLLGVVIQDVTKDLAAQFHLPDTKGALVSQVNKDSAASKAGIKAGDAIIRYDDKPVEDSSQLRNFVAATAPGSKVAIVVNRNGKQETFSAAIGILTPQKLAETGEMGSQPLSKFGLRVEPLTPELAKRSGHENESGVLISAIDDASGAALAGLQAGDLITEVNRRKVTSMDDLRDAVAKSEDGNSILLLVGRKGMSTYVILRSRQ